MLSQRARAPPSQPRERCHLASLGEGKPEERDNTGCCSRVREPFKHARLWCSNNAASRDRRSDADVSNSLAAFPPDLLSLPQLARRGRDHRSSHRASARWQAASSFLPAAPARWGLAWPSLSSTCSVAFSLAEARLIGAAHSLRREAPRRGASGARFDSHRVGACYSYFSARACFASARALRRISSASPPRGLLSTAARCDAQLSFPRSKREALTPLTNPAGQNAQATWAAQKEVGVAKARRRMNRSLRRRRCGMACALEPRDRRRSLRPPL